MTEQNTNQNPDNDIEITPDIKAFYERADASSILPTLNLVKMPIQGKWEHRYYMLLLALVRDCFISFAKGMIYLKKRRHR